MTKAKKRRNSLKKAQKRRVKQLQVAQTTRVPSSDIDKIDKVEDNVTDPVVEAVEADGFESEYLDNIPERSTNIIWTALLVGVGLILLIAGVIIWSTMATEPSPSQTPRPTAIPLEGSANPQQLQSGGAGVQNGGAVDDSNDSSGGQLQPQQDLSPQEQENLLR
jgi:hypothetical protein